MRGDVSTALEVAKLRERVEAVKTAPETTTLTRAERISSACTEISTCRFALRHASHDAEHHSSRFVEAEGHEAMCQQASHLSLAQSSPRPSRLLKKSVAFADEA